MRRASGIVAVVALVVILSGCSASPTAGTVHDKEHTSAYTSIIPVCSKTCTMIPIFHPERWSLDIYADADHHGWVSVSESTYDAVQVGDYWKAANR